MRISRGVIIQGKFMGLQKVLLALMVFFCQVPPWYRLSPSKAFVVPTEVCLCHEQGLAHGCS